jgi:flagellar hook-length control protein FliK
LVNLETERSMTSVLNSATSAAHHAKKAEKLSQSKASGEQNAGADGEFAALFGAMMATPGGQDLAALEGKASPPMVGLAAEVLGPTVHIITASTPALSDDSLYAFARSQGMDEDALALIFQKSAPVTLATATPALTLPADVEGLSTEAAPTLTLATAQLATALKPEEKAIASVLSQPLAETAKKPATLDLGDDASLRWTLGKAADAVPGTTPLAQSSFFGLNGVRTLMPATPPVQAAPTDMAMHPESAQQNLAASLILGASEAAQFARRLEMKQASQRAERTTPGWLPQTPAGTGPLPTAEALLLAEEAQLASLDTLILAPDLAPEDLSQLLAGRQPGPETRQAATAETSSTGNTSGAPRPDQTQRTEQYERISQRLGEALGQRLAAQMARGDWRVDLALKPYELGNIDIELTMKEGALQASFSASQAITRELIADSLPRLKEVLSQLGMDVATMNVNVRQNGQHGGNPTPGRSSSGSGGQAGSAETEKVSEVPTSMAARNTGKGPDGLDVLV